MDDIRELLVKAGIANNVMNPNLKKNKAIAQMETDCIPKPGLTFLQVRDALLGMGHILETNEEKHYFLSTIRVGIRAAILIAQTGKNQVDVATWAEEGLIPQNTARKALDQFRAALK